MLFSKFTRFLLILIASSLLVSPSFAKVFYSKEEAMKLAFGDDATVEMMSLFPTPEEVAKIEQLAKVKLESNLFSFYVGKKQGQIIGYAAIESHNVRTKPETLLVVLDAEGKLRNVYTLAFHEPPEYQPPARWYEQLGNHTLEQLSFSQDIQGISGATLSTRAALNAARKVLAVYQVSVKDKQK
ncbi:MAG: FMN-binding protein [Methylococcaceae bacterium]|nr:FMN-binding protein [Methylococcaceae bacterium]